MFEHATRSLIAIHETSCSYEYVNQILRGVQCNKIGGVGSGVCYKSEGPTSSLGSLHGNMISCSEQLMESYLAFHFTTSLLQELAYYEEGGHSVPTSTPMYPSGPTASKLTT